MTDDLAAHYAEHAYPRILHDFAHPAQVFALAGLYGLPRKDLARLRILELGCNRGDVIRWIAKTLPNATCLGVDIVPEAIDQARIDGKGLKNLTYQVADLATFAPDGEFDLIIAHGMFSWIPDEARDGLLRVAGQHLAPGGALLLSWNNLPGAILRTSVRELMLLEEARGKPLTAALDRLAIGLAGVSALPHVAHLNDTLAHLKRQDPGVLRHDEGSPEMEAFYLLQVVEWAGEHGLSYLADMNLQIDWLDAAPPASREAVKDLTRLEALQYADYIHNIAFRRGIFVRADDGAKQRAAPDPGFALDLYATPKMESLGVDDVSGKERFGIPGQPEAVLTPDADNALAIMRAMSRKAPAPVKKFLKAAGLTPDAANAGVILMAAARGAVDLSIGPMPAKV